MGLNLGQGGFVDNAGVDEEQDPVDGAEAASTVFVGRRFRLVAALGVFVGAGAGATVGVRQWRRADDAGKKPEQSRDGKDESSTHGLGGEVSRSARIPQERLASALSGTNLRSSNTGSEALLVRGVA